MNADTGSCSHQALLIWFGQSSCPILWLVLFFLLWIKYSRTFWARKWLQIQSEKAAYFLQLPPQFFRSNIFPHLAQCVSETAKTWLEETHLLLPGPNANKTGSKPLKINTCPVQVFTAKHISRDHCSQRAEHTKAVVQTGAGITNTPGFCLVKRELCLS